MLLLFGASALSIASTSDLSNSSEPAPYRLVHEQCLNSRFQTFNEVLQDRRTTIVGALLVWNRNLTPRDRGVKLCAIEQDAFYFLRGTNHMYYHDFYRMKEHDPRLMKFAEVTWIQGDLHLQNFGSFDNSNNQVTFNVNDFDEAVVADFQLDIWRFSTSLLLALAPKKYSETQTDELIEHFLQGYFQTVALAATGFEHGSFIAESVVDPMAKFLDKVQASNDRKKMLDTWAPVGANGYRAFDYANSKGKLSAAPAHIVDLFLGEGFIEYYNSLTVISKAKFPLNDLKIKDVAARNLAGTGSLGAGRYYVLLEGPSLHQDDDIILDVKEQGRPAPFFYMGEEFMRNYTAHFGYNDAQRHNFGLLSLLSQVDPFLGYFREPKKNDTFSVRQRSPWKKSLKLTSYNFSDIALIVNQLGAIIGSDHSKASNQAIIHVNDSRTYNFCPRDFGQRLTQKLNLTAFVPLKPQKSAESIEFSKLVKEIANFYAHRVTCDHNIFRTFAHEVLDLKNCTLLELWKPDNTTDTSRNVRDRGSTVFAPMQAAVVYPSSGPTLTLVFVFFSGCAVTAVLFASIQRLSYDHSDRYMLIR